MSLTQDRTEARPLPDRGLRWLRPLFAWYFDRTWEVHEHGHDNVPASGPVILASNHLGWLDGPLLIIKGPRPAHAMVKSDSFTGRSGLLLRIGGQISVRRTAVDAGALRRAVRALSAGQVIVIYPEGKRGAGDVAFTKGGAAYLALVTGAPIVPVAVIGTREPGGGVDSRPPKGTRLDVAYGEPLTIDPQPWPRTAHLVAEANARIRDHLRTHVDWATSTLERDLPGPLPEEAAP